MFDARLRPLIDPPMTWCGAFLARKGVSADQVTFGGFACGFVAFVAICWGWFAAGFVLIVASRLADGLDGAVARATAKTDLGGFYDISLDFIFYGLIPLGFAIFDPQVNALAAACLLASFYANGSVFLAFAVAAEKRGLRSDAQGVKAFYYVTGIAEGAETICLFLLMCVLPAWFAIFAYGFCVICFVSAAARLVNAAKIWRG